MSNRLLYSYIMRHIPNAEVPLLSFMLSFLIGAISWHGELAGMLALPFLFILWGHTKNRTHAYLLALFYYLGCGYPLIKGAAVFFQNPLNHTPSILAGIAIWIAPSLLLALPWGVLWGKRHIAIRITAILLLVALPPLGIFGWGNPITASGVFFPGLGWAGIALMLAVFVLCAMRAHLIKIVVILMLSAISNLIYQPTPPPAGWVAVNTQLGWLKDDMDDYAHHQKLIALAHGALKPGTRVILFPEMVVGSWTENSAFLWQDVTQNAKANGTIILLGTTLREASGSYSNVLLPLGTPTASPLPDRVPVPISMWKPWAKDGASADFWSSGIHSIAGKKIATLICYEQLLTWPILHSMLHKPEVIIGAANGWWAKDTVIPQIQQQAMNAWGRLFKVGVVGAVNG